MWREIEELKQYKLGKSVHVCGEGNCTLREMGSRYSVCPITRMVHNVVFQNDEDEEDDEEDHTVRKKHVDELKSTIGKERDVANMFEELYKERRRVAGENIIKENVPRDQWASEIKRRSEFTAEEKDTIIKLTLSIDHPKTVQIFLAVCYTLAGHLRNGVIMERAAWCTPSAHKLEILTRFKNSDLTEGLEILKFHPLSL